MTRRYYHERIRKTLQFIIPSGKRVLFFGPSHEVGAKSGKYKVNGKFDYIIVNGVLGKSKDMMQVLTNLQSVCTPETRLIVYQHNFLWQGILSVLEKLNLKRVEGVQNWLSITDLKAYLEAAGFGITRMFRRTLCPAYLGGVGELINYIAAILPIFDPLKLDQFIIARPSPMLFPNGKPESLTICLTVRNEKGNIEKIVRELPKVCKKQEILFVEGHSTDGTREEIERVIKLYPQKNIRVIGQPGRGQGDAIRVGFKDARGDIVILYEGDGTSDTGDIKYFYEAMRERRFEFIEGSRFVYPLDYKSMPLSKQLGNIFFAKWFSFFLGQTSTDVLSGIKAILKKDYETLYERWGFLGTHDPFGDFELLYGAARMGLKFGEIPMRYYPRVYGKPHSKLFTHGIFLLKMAAHGYWTFRKT
ncbi:MAG: Glycosyltransferase [Candidatus Woesebacteria bacterium GW2011_GWB1_41_10]|uniref:Glycosyltransferase n=1 Tax=Candidatus Woesebacteria bacterium GW2011_GWB1_41_10 TaxID=1618577 RepID=A0A0G0UH72_9BACT|nr:MAG: Glycosyltransferase [Candidatus Woesebacteria bacterium GW2011_GWB1_41_10]